MMHSDFYALSACALSVLYIPFMIIAQLRFAHILQNLDYSNARYFVWLKRNFAAAFLPPIGTCALVVLGRVVMDAYLGNTALYEVYYIYGFFVVLMVIAAAVAFVLYHYTQNIKIETNEQPIRCTNRLVGVYLLACALVCVLALLSNLIEAARVAVFFVPVLTPLLAPLSNLLYPGKRKTAQA